MAAARSQQAEGQRWTPHPGESTAHVRNVSYRVAKFAVEVHGSWLDFGCADGGYVAELLRAGADHVTGVDVREDQIAAARSRGLEGARFEVASGEGLALESSTFDGALVNEVLEHVVDQDASLSELKRVLRPGATLVVISPNRWFPFEGHGVHLRGWRWPRPAPFVPWLPKRLTQPMVDARNYWPYELIDVVGRGGFVVTGVEFVWPVLERYRWLPGGWSEWYRLHIESFDSLPVLRRFGVSTLVVAKRPWTASDGEIAPRPHGGRLVHEAHPKGSGI